MYNEVSHIVCFYTFCVKCKENDLHEKYIVLSGPAENVSSPTISQMEQNLWFYFIYKDYAQRAKFLSFKIFEK